MNESAMSLSEIELEAFHRDGYIVMPKLASDAICDQIIRVSNDHLASQLAPLEYEADVKYPGAPTSLTAKGGHTIRRLLHAYARDQIFRQWSTSPEVKQHLQLLFDAQDIRLSQSHHNCVMTKRPGYSSATMWHQDNRYWSFDEQNLISVWLATGSENEKNGCLRVIPGTHKLQFDAGRYDAVSFLRSDLGENIEMISREKKVLLAKGDVLFFHSRLFHAAGKNESTETKLSLVFTYHTAANNPISATRSARNPSINL